MNLRQEPYMFRSDIDTCNIIPRITDFMDNQPVKNRQYLKPLDISNTAQETNKESTSELEICIVLGLIRGMVDGMDGGMICIMTLISSCKQSSKSEI